MSRLTDFVLRHRLLVVVFWVAVAVAAASSSVTAVGLPPRPSRRTHASTTVTSGQDIGPPLTLNEPATANGVGR
jgi:hypothetical protein